MNDSPTPLMRLRGFLFALVVAGAMLATFGAVVWGGMWLAATLLAH